MNLTRLILSAWILIGSIATVFIIAAGLLRCSKCGGWHEDKEQDENCPGR